MTSDTRRTVQDYAARNGLPVAEVVEWWSERAAIREFDAGETREDAERLAFAEVMQRWPGKETR